MTFPILTKHSLAGYLALFVLLTTSLPVWAQDKKEQKESVDEDGPVVRRRLLYRSTRAEVAPVFGMTLADAFNRNLMVGLNANFHLTNEIGIGVMAGYGASQISTSLRDNIEVLLKDSPGGGLGEIEYSYLKWLVGVEGSLVPLHGKFAFLTNSIVNYDFHINAGVAFVSEGALNAQTQQDVPNSSIAGTRVAPSIGLGMRFYMGDMFSLNLDFRDYIFSRTLSKTSGAQSELSNNVLFTLGFSFFLPTTLKVSR